LRRDNVTYMSSALQTLSVSCLQKKHTVYVGDYTETDTTEMLSPPTAWRQKLT